MTKISWLNSKQFATKQQQHKFTTDKTTLNKKEFATKQQKLYFISVMTTLTIKNSLP
jgi:hypothetical protein